MKKGEKDEKDEKDRRVINGNKEGFFFFSQTSTPGDRAPLTEYLRSGIDQFSSISSG